MKQLLVGVMCAAAVFPAGDSRAQTSPNPQAPTFRSGVDVIAVDVAVVDSRGRPVEDLGAADFAVSIDGTPRRVVSAELVRFDVGGAQRGQGPPDETHFSTNLTPPNGRLVVIAVDQLGIRVGAARPVLMAAARFLDLLGPADRVAFIAYPAPGAYVDFTNDHARIRRAMETVVGSQQRFQGKFNIGVYEALRIVDESNRETFERVVARECRNLRGEPFEVCERDVLRECRAMVDGLRRDTSASLQGLHGVLDQLRLIDGPKAMILLSEGIIIDAPNELDDVVEAAATARVSINVLLMDVPRDDVTISQARPTIDQDRDLQVSGLRNLAYGSRGDIYNVLGRGDRIFERLSSELAAYYLIGVEQLPGDRDGERHRIDLEVRRRGVSVRSRRAFVLAPAASGRVDPDETLSEILRSPFGIAELPLRVTTFARQDEAGDRVRLLVAADVGQPGSAPQEFTIGYALVDATGGVAVSGSERRTLTASDVTPGAALQYLGEVVVPPGTYSLRLAVVDAEGRRGGVVREVTAWRLDGEALAVGDLMIGNVESGARMQIRPGVEPRVDAGVGVYMELYASSPAEFDGTTVRLEIAADQDGPALADGEALLATTELPTRRAATGVVVPDLPAGSYVARARVMRRGEVVGLLARPFVLLNPPPDPAAAAALPIAAPAPVLEFDEVRRFDAALVLGRETVGGMLDFLERTSPGATGALAEARAGRYGIAALEALAAGDQTAASFLKGLDWLAQGQLDRAVTQLDIAAGSRREFFPGAFYLGAALAAAGRDRDAAGVWQLSFGTEPRPALAYALFADARLRGGQPASVVDVLRPVWERTPDDDAIARPLVRAYLLLERYDDVIPVLDSVLSRSPQDQQALLAAVYAQYRVTTRDQLPVSTDVEAKLARYVRAYEGPQRALLETYLDAVRDR